MFFSWLKIINVFRYDGGAKFGRGYVDLKLPETYPEQTLTAQQTELAYEARGEETDFDAVVVGAGLGMCAFSLRELELPVPPTRRQRLK